MDTLSRHILNRAKIGLIVTIIAIAVPFVKYNGIHLLLFNFYNGRFEFLFNVWEVSNVYLSLIFILFAAAVILVLNFTYSRYFCGTMCPKSMLKNIFTDFIEAKIFKITRIKNRQSGEKIDNHKINLFLSYTLFALLVLFATIPFFFYFIPYDVVFGFLTSGFEEEYDVLLYLWIATSIYLYAEALFFKEFFCSYMCPYQLVNSIFVNDDKSFYDFNDKKNCIECGACVRVCPVPKLDIKEGFDLRCISCGDCSAVCEDVMRAEKIDHGLIRYATFNNRLNKSKLFSFSTPVRSFVLISISLALLYFCVSYFVDIDNLGYCNFSNKDLYK